MAGILSDDGGGGICELPSVREYASNIIESLLPLLNSLQQNVELIFEPGRTLFEAFGGLLMNVVGNRKMHDSAGMHAIIHASDFINSRPGVVLRHSAGKYSWLRKPVSVRDKKGWKNSDNRTYQIS